MLKINNLTKHYKGSDKGVNNVTLHIDKGDIYAFIGHNGAGKTTTLKCVTGIHDFDDKQVLLDTVRKLRDAGFIVSMDDFGAGYSSLNSLKEMQLDVLKIDADFFRGAEAQERDVLLLKLS